jgi:hypothetical protein
MGPHSKYPKKVIHNEAAHPPTFLACQEQKKARPRRTIAQIR